MLIAVCGMKGVGKTHTTLREIEHYLKSKHGRLGRKALIFDVNAPMERSYERYRTCDLDQIHLLKSIECRRVVALNKDTSPMTIAEKQEAAYTILKLYTQGLIVLEDLNNYVLQAKSTDFIGAITTNRHKDQDIIIHYQSLSALCPRMWQNCSVIRFHHQLDSIDRYMKRIPNPELMKLAQIIVDEQYYRGNKRYYIYVKNLDNKLIGTTEFWFRRACQQYLNNDSRALASLMRETDDRGRPKHKSLKDAVETFVQRRMHYILP